MSNAMKNRLAAAKTGAGESMKAKRTRAPLIDITPPLQVVANTLDEFEAIHDEEVAVEVEDSAAAPSLKERMATARTTAPAESSAPTALAIAVDLLQPEPETPGAQTPMTVAPVTIMADEKKPAGSTPLKVKTSLLDELCAPPAPMGSVGESRLMTVPLTEDAYALMQRLDRDAAMQLGRPINRTQLITKALETVLADPERYASEYVTAQQGGTMWKRRTQGRIPTELAGMLPTLRYTGSHRQSAGMMVSIALGAYLEKAARELTM